MSYFLHVVALVGIYAILAVSLDLMVGRARLLVMCQASFFAVGAYTAGILSVSFGSDLLVEVLVAFVVGVAAGFIVGYPSTIVKRDQVAITTIAFQMVVFALLYNLVEITGGPFGVVGIREATLLGVNVGSSPLFLLVIWVFLGGIWGIVSRVKRSPLGRILMAGARDEGFVESLGKNLQSARLGAFGLSAALASVAGVLYAHLFLYIDPSSFDLMESVLIAAMVVIGGSDSKWGAVLGAAILVTLPEALRMIGMPASIAGDLRQLVYGLALVAVILVRPAGLLGRTPVVERRKP